MAKLHNPAPVRVVILRALQLGDLLCALPAWRALRRALPQAHITLVGLPWAAGFVERFGVYLDGFIEFPGLPAFPEQPARLDLFPAFLAEVRRWGYDLALQMQGSGEVSNTLVSLFGARTCAGFYPAGSACPAPTRFLEYPEAEPEVRRLLRLVEFLGFPPQGEELEFPLRPEDQLSLRATLAEAGGGALPAGEYAVFHTSPGGGPTNTGCWRAWTASSCRCPSTWIRLTACMA
jgi:ADP-heptose:LPS heptosyltransferase